MFSDNVVPIGGEVAPRFILTVTWKDSEVEEYICDFFGVSAENRDLLTTGVADSGGEIVPSGFLTLSEIRKIAVTEIPGEPPVVLN